MKVNLTKRQVEVIQVVFDQLCCDHFRDCIGNTPYTFKEEQDEFVNILTIMEDRLE